MKARVWASVLGLLALRAVLAALHSSAFAQVPNVPWQPFIQSGAFSTGGGPYVGPCDSVAHCYAAWSVARAPRATDATGTANSWDYSCNAGVNTGTIKFQANGLTNTGALGVCVGTILVTAVYDPINSLKITAASGVTYTSSCVNSKPCIHFAGTNNLQTAANAYTGAGNATISIAFVGECTAAGSCNTQNGVMGLGGATFQMGFGLNSSCAATANTVYEYAGNCSGLPSATASASAFHAVQYVYNGASSLINVDGSDSSTANPGGNTPGTPKTIFVASVDATTDILTGDIAEMQLFDNYVLTSGDRTSLHSNASAFYATP